jgi:hypothetical protein
MTIAAFTALQMAFQNAIAATAQGGTVATAAKKEASDALIVALRQFAAYIQGLVSTLTLSQILSSGFDVVNTNTKPSPLATPVFTLDNTVSGQVTAYLQMVPNAKAYQVQYSIGDGAWQEFGIYPNTKGIVLTNTIAGTIYNMRIRAVGGSTQYSAWSATITIMAT